jgi:hypothetical protein
MVSMDKMIEYLKDYTLQNTVDHDDEHTIKLVDVFTPDGDDIDSGTRELELLADHLCDCLDGPPTEKELDWKEEFSNEFHKHYDDILPPEIVIGSIQWHIKLMEKYIK